MVDAALEHPESAQVSPRLENYDDPTLMMMTRLYRSGWRALWLRLCGDLDCS